MSKQQLSEFEKQNPWIVIVELSIQPGRYSSPDQAKRAADRNHSHSSYAEVRHRRTGRSHHRRRGKRRGRAVWFTDVQVYGRDNIKAERKRRIIDA